MKAIPSKRRLGTYAIAGMIVIGGGYFFSQRLGNQQYVGEQQQEIDRAKAEHIPLEPEDLRPQLASSDPKNAASVLSQAARTLTSIEVKVPNSMQGEIAAFAMGGVPNIADRNRSAAFLDNFSPVLSLAHQAGHLEQCDFGADYSQGLKFDQPNYTALFRVERLICADAELQAMAHQDSKALEDLDVASRLADDAGSVRTFASLRASVDQENYFLRTLESVLSLDPSDSQLRRGAGRLMLALKPSRPLAFYAEGELVLDRVILKQLHDLPQDQLWAFEGLTRREEATKLSAKLLSPQMQPLYDAYLINNFRKFIEATPADPSNWEALHKAALQEEHMLMQPVPGNLFNGIIIPQIESYCELYEKEITRRRAATAVVAALARSNGSFPPRIASGTDLTDPFSGGELAVNRQSNLFEVSSEGPRDRHMPPIVFAIHLAPSAKSSDQL